MVEPLSLGQLSRVLLRHWILIVALTILGGGAGLALTRFMTPVYTATAIQLVKGVPGTGAAANYEAAQYAVSRAKSYPSFVYSSPVLEGVRSDFGNAKSLTDLREDLDATNPVDTPLLKISATGPTREDARDKANSAARHMARFITQIETVNGKSPISVETAVQAPLPTDPTSPKTLLNVALAALIGFVLATVIALVDSYARPQPRAVEHREIILGWPEPEPEVIDEGGETQSVHDTRPLLPDDAIDATNLRPAYPAAVSMEVDDELTALQDGPPTTPAGRLLRVTEVPRVVDLPSPVLVDDDAAEHLHSARNGRRSATR